MVLQSRRLVVENLKEYYELCKTIKPELFYYPAFVKEETECGTIGCLWGNAPVLLPDKIFKFVKNTSTRFCSTKEYANSNINNYSNVDAIEDYFKPKLPFERAILEYIFCGDGIYYPDGFELDGINHWNMDIPLDIALSRFKLALDMLDKYYETKSQDLN